MLHAQAARNALRDAGIDKSEVDAVFTCGIGAMASVQLCEYLGIIPRYTDNTMTGGSSFEIHVEHAAAAMCYTSGTTGLPKGVGLSLSIPIYSNRQIKSNIEQARVNALTAGLNEQNAKNQLRKSIEQTYTDLKNSMKKYEATKEQFTSAEVSYKNTETKFNLGLVTAIDFLVEKNNYFQAQSNLIQAKYDYVFRSKILDFYVGTPISF
mgnify:CR=1 FL=1